MALDLDLSTVRVDGSLESYHRFLIFDGVSDFLRHLDERVLWMNITIIRPQGNSSDRWEDSRHPMQGILSHQVVGLLGNGLKCISSACRDLL